MLKSFLFWGNGDWAQGNHLSCARKSSGASTDWARSRQKFFLDNISHSPVWNSLGETEDFLSSPSHIFCANALSYILLSFSRTASKAFVRVASKPFACNAATPSMVVPPGEQT